MTRIPETLWHITPEENLPGILAEGLQSPWGQCFAGSLENAARFIALRAMMSPEQQWAAISVPSAGLIAAGVREDEIAQNFDHDPRFFGTDDSWIVTRQIPIDWLVGAGAEFHSISFGEPADA